MKASRRFRKSKPSGLGIMVTEEVRAILAAHPDIDVPHPPPSEPMAVAWPKAWLPLERWELPDGIGEGPADETGATTCLLLDGNGALAWLAARAPDLADP